MDEAYDALRRLSCAGPAEAKRILGSDADDAVTERALGLLCESLAGERRVERVLELAGDRIRREWPTGPERRSALLLLMAARGTARAHTPLGFDRASLLALA